MYDCTNTDSFQDIHRVYYPYIKERFKDVQCVIVGYKTDLTKTVKTEDGKSLAKWMNFPFAEMSDKDVMDHCVVIQTLAHSIRVNRLKVEQSLKKNE